MCAIPAEFPELAVGSTGWRLIFAQHSTERAHIFRRVGGPTGPRHRVAAHSRSPYFDEDVLKPSTFVEYDVYVQAEADNIQDRSHPMSAST